MMAPLGLIAAWYSAVAVLSVAVIAIPWAVGRGHA